MKVKKNVPPAPIVCLLINNEEKHAAHSLIFGLIDILLAQGDPGITAYFEYLDYYFTPTQYALFRTRIVDKRNKEVRVNQQHFIIFFAMLHLTTLIYTSKRMIGILKSEFFVDQKDSFGETGNSLIDFCDTAMNELRKEYKNNNALIIALGKVDAYRMVD